MVAPYSTYFVCMTYKLSVYFYCSVMLQILATFDFVSLPDQCLISPCVPQSFLFFYLSNFIPSDLSYIVFLADTHSFC